MPNDKRSLKWFQNKSATNKSEFHWITSKIKWFSECCMCKWALIFFSFFKFRFSERVYRDLVSWKRERYSTANYANTFAIFALSLHSNELRINHKSVNIDSITNSKTLVVVSFCFFFLFIHLMVMISVKSIIMLLKPIKKITIISWIGAWPDDARKKKKTLENTLNRCRLI